MTKFMDPADIKAEFWDWFYGGGKAILQGQTREEAIEFINEVFEKNQYQNLQEFLDEAVFKCWIQDY